MAREENKVGNNRGSEREEEMWGKSKKGKESEKIVVKKGKTEFCVSFIPAFLFLSFSTINKSFFYSVVPLHGMERHESK